MQTHVKSTEIRNVPARWVAYRRATAPRSELGATITSPNMLPGIYELANRHGAKAGAPYVRYLDCRENEIDVQIGVPLSGPIPPDGDIAVDLYSACRAVVVEFFGPYSDLAEAYMAGESHIASERLTSGGAMWERYDGPGDPDGNARVILYWPIE